MSKLHEYLEMAISDSYKLKATIKKEKSSRDPNLTFVSFKLSGMGRDFKEQGQYFDKLAKKVNNKYKDVHLLLSNLQFGTFKFTNKMDDEFKAFVMVVENLQGMGFQVYSRGKRVATNMEFTLKNL